MERLQKILSQAGVASRRASERLMLEGRVTVNGATVSELGTKADPERDDIRVDGRRIRMPERHRYILLNKPRGYVTTRSDPQQRPTVLDLVGVREYVYPVGRLDFDSEGLIILTNDGDLAARLTHPSHGVERLYDAHVLGVPDERDLTRLRHGIVIDGRRTLPADVQRLGPDPRPRSHARRRVARAGPHPHAPEDGGRERRVSREGEGSAVLRIAIREGRNRQIRKMFDAIGHPIDRLRRVAIGPVSDNRLKLGQWRDLTADEVRRLQAVAAREPADRHRG
jgi:pseudouridine synthase